MTQILRFEMNVPAEVALKEAGPGKPIEGRYGNRVMYTLADDRVMYVAPIVASRITDLGIQPGEVFQVRKQVKRQGRQRLIEWHVERLQSEPEAQLERELRESIAAVQATRTAKSSEAIKEPNDQPPLTMQGHTALPYIAPIPIVPVSNASGDSNPLPASQNGNGCAPVMTKRQDVLKAPTLTARDAGTDMGCVQERATQSIPAPTPAVVPIANGHANGSPSSLSKNGNNAPPVTTKLEHALKTAISAAYNAEKFGAELGYVVRFDADAIKSMAITVLINMSEGGRR